MLVLVSYDVSTSTPQGRKRLRQVAKQCVNYGQRVQNSVFECTVDATQFVKLKQILTKIIVEDEDSLRFYNLGNNYKNKCEHIGIKPSLDMAEDVLMV